MKQKKVKLLKNTAGKWSYEDNDFEKGCMTLIEVTSMFIARFAVTLEAMQHKEGSVEIEIVIKKR